MNRDSLIAFLRERQDKWTHRTADAIAYRFGNVTLGDLSAVIASAPGAFSVKAGRMGLLVGLSR